VAKLGHGPEKRGKFGIDEQGSHVSSLILRGQLFERVKNFIVKAYGLFQRGSSFRFWVLGFGF
jgi:hypothetical protein